MGQLMVVCAAKTNNQCHRQSAFGSHVGCHDDARSRLSVKISRRFDISYSRGHVYFRTLLPLCVVNPIVRLSSMVPSEGNSTPEMSSSTAAIDVNRCRYPYCVVWTPLPLITWIIPIIGHMGIATSAGVIRDFAGPYFVSQDDMAFGWPTKYWQLDANKVVDGQHGWDDAVKSASDIYMHRMHNLFYDNCHSHVSLSLNLMQYDGKTNYNMIKLFFLMLIHGKYVSFGGFLKTWLPFLVISFIIVVFFIYFGK